MKLSKKGGTEPTSNFAIGLIIGIVFIIILGGIVIKFYAASQQTKESFELFYSEIETLKDGEEAKEVLFMSDKYRIVAFPRGESEVLCSLIPEGMKKPKSCADNACICYCKSQWGLPSIASDCEKRGYCKIINWEYDPSFQSYNCLMGEGSYIPGESGGLMELYYKREGDTIFISKDETTYYPEDYTTSITTFNTFVEKLEQCSKSDQTCKCLLAHPELEEPFSLKFSSQKEISLHDEEKQISTNLFDFSFTYDSEGEGEGKQETTWDLIKSIKTLLEREVYTWVYNPDTKIMEIHPDYVSGIPYCGSEQKQL